MMGFPNSLVGRMVRVIYDANLVLVQLCSTYYIACYVLVCLPEDS